MIQGVVVTLRLNIILQITNILCDMCSKKVDMRKIILSSYFLVLDNIWQNLF